MSRCSPVSSSSSSSRLASTEVSGVRSSCEASATNSRWRTSALSVSVRAPSRAWSIASSVRRQLGDLVVGLGVGEGQRRVARALDPAGGRRQLGDRLHRAARGGQAGQQGQQRAAEHAEREEHLHAVGGVLDVGDPAARTAGTSRRDSRRPPPGASRRASRRPRTSCGTASRSRARPCVCQPTRSSSVITRIAAFCDAAKSSRSTRLPTGFSAACAGDDPQQRVLLQRVGAAGHLVVEVLVDLPRREHADDRREAAQDHQRQGRGAAGQAPADRQRPIRGGRSPRRGPYGGVEARHRLRASVSGWTRRPRSCW